MKTKISISLDEDLLRNVDYLIDGDKIQNRSFAIEYLVRSSLKNVGVTKALVLLGGPDISDRPFSMVDSNGGRVTLIEHTVNQLSLNGVRDIVFVCAKGLIGKVRDIFGDGGKYGVNVDYVSDDKPVGSAGAVSLVRGIVNEDFFVVSGDVFFEFDLEKMLCYHRKNNNIATVAVTTTDIGDSKDSLVVEGDQIISFEYGQSAVKTHLVNAGVYLFSPKMFDYIPSLGSLEKSVFPKIASLNRLNCYLFLGKWEHAGD